MARQERDWVSEDRREFVVGAQLDAKRLDDADLLRAEQVSNYRAVIDLVPTSIDVIVLVVLSPVAVPAGIETRERWEESRDLFLLRHIEFELDSQSPVVAIVELHQSSFSARPVTRQWRFRSCHLV